MTTPLPSEAVIVVFMCRSIKRLRGTQAADEEEIRAAARQFVRKISGYNAPAKRNEEAFERAVAEVSRASARLLDELPKLRATPPTSDPAGQRLIRVR